MSPGKYNDQEVLECCRNKIQLILVFLPIPESTCPSFQNLNQHPVDSVSADLQVLWKGKDFNQNPVTLHDLMTAQ